MPIAIVVEDGTNVAGANSYQDVAAVRLYAENRGVVLPVSNDEVAAMLIKTIDYLEAQACLYQGKMTYAGQSLQWPRTGVILNCDEVPPNVIPKSLISAQAQLLIAINAGFDLQPNFSYKDYVIKKKVGPIEKEFVDPTKVGISPTLGAADALLAPLFGQCASDKFSIRTVRV